MIDEGVPVAISTDCNPGSSPTTSMPLVMNLACISMRLTPAEALTLRHIMRHVLLRWKIKSVHLKLENKVMLFYGIFQITKNYNTFLELIT